MLIISPEIQLVCQHHQNRGFQLEKVKASSGSAKGKTFCLFDVPGQEKLRALWKTYTRKCDGILYIIDSADSGRFEESKIELAKTARMTGNVPIVVICNKQVNIHPFCFCR